MSLQEDVLHYLDGEFSGASLPEIAALDLVEFKLLKTNDGLKGAQKPDVAMLFSQMKDELDCVEDAVDSLSITRKQAKKLLQDHQITTSEAKKVLLPQVDRMESLDCMLDYLNTVKRVEQMKRVVVSKESEARDILQLFENRIEFLENIREYMKSGTYGQAEKSPTVSVNECRKSKDGNRSNNIRGAAGGGIIEYAEQMVRSCYSFTAKLWMDGLNQQLRELGWPKQAAAERMRKYSDPNSTGDDELVQKIETYVKNLLRLEELYVLQSSTEDVSVLLKKRGYFSAFSKDSRLIGKAKELWALEPFTAPLLRRFQYHFYVNKNTNMVDKPEWMFMYCLEGIREYSTVFYSFLQGIFDKNGLGFINVKCELIAALVSATKERMHTTLSSLLEKGEEDSTAQSLFCHTINESMKFDERLQELHRYPRLGKSTPQQYGVCALVQARSKEARSMKRKGTVYPVSMGAVSMSRVTCAEWLRLEKQVAQKRSDEWAKADDILLRWRKGTGPEELEGKEDGGGEVHVTCVYMRALAHITALRKHMKAIPGVRDRLRFFSEVVSPIMNKLYKVLLVGGEILCGRIGGQGQQEDMWALTRIFNSFHLLFGVFNAWDEESMSLEMSKQLWNDLAESRTGIWRSFGQDVDKGYQKLEETCVGSLAAYFDTHFANYFAEVRVWERSGAPDDPDLPQWDSLFKSTRFLRFTLNIFRRGLVPDVYDRLRDKLAAQLDETVFKSITRKRVPVSTAMKMKSDLSCLEEEFRSHDSAEDIHLPTLHECFLLLELHSSQVKAIKMALQEYLDAEQQGMSGSGARKKKEDVALDTVRGILAQHEITHLSPSQVLRIISFWSIPTELLTK